MGIALDYEKRREILIEKDLKRTGIIDKRVLRAFRDVPRHEFVPPGYQDAAYEDRPLPIGGGQVITQPTLVAAMTQALGLRGNEKVLEVGTGSGFQAAVLARLGKEVYTIERIDILAERARQVLGRLGYANVRVIVGDGTLGLPEEAPFDAIMVTAGAPTLPKPLIEQMKEGGRMVIPIGLDPATQLVKLITKEGGKLHFRGITWAHFVLLIGEHGWPVEPASSR